MKIATFYSQELRPDARLNGGEKIAVIMQVNEARNIHAALDLLLALPTTKLHNGKVVAAARKIKNELADAPIW